MTQLTRLHLDPVGGVAGDMLLGSLLDLGADLDAVRRALSSFGEPALRLDVTDVEVNGERALYVRSLVGAAVHHHVPHSAGAEHSDDEAHGHHHLSDILHRIDRAALTPGAREQARRIFQALAAAEAEVHGGTSDGVHLHEVGELDAIMDVVGVVVALESLGSPVVTCAPLPSGSGTVRTSHGILACPVPAVVALSRRFAIPLEPVDVQGETVTPTGVAVLSQCCERFERLSTAGAARRGAGAGTRRFPTRPNVLWAFGWS